MPSRFERVRVAGYRRLQDLELELRPLNVFIGANGVGKSSLLEVMALLAASAQGRLQATLSDFGGIGSVITHGRQDLAIGLRLAANGAAAPVDYDLALKIGALAYGVEHERLTQQHDPNANAPFKHIDSHHGDIRYYELDSKKLVRPTWEHQPFETSLAQVPRMFQAPEHFRQVLASSTLYHALDVSPRAPVRLPQPMRPARYPGIDGEDLYACLYSLRESARDRFEVIEDTLKAAFPTFERLEFPPVAAGTITLAWRDRDYIQPLYPHQLSEGTLRFLWLLTLLQSPDLPAVILIDEPEVSLHPEMLRLLADLMREAAQRTQLFVATHADRLVRFLEPGELVAMDLGEHGEAVATRADELDLQDWLADYSLDELWRLGRLGGRA
jgi:predicted ATPase